MELDEFKARWNTIQDKEFNQQKISQQKLEQIIMNTTETLGQLHAKSIYWKKLGKSTSQILIAVLIVLLLLTLLDQFINHSTVGSMILNFLYFTIMVVYCLVMNWGYNKQEQIFIKYNGGNVKEAVTQTITTFKSFYRKLTVIYLFMYPAYYYAFIKLLIPYWHPSLQTILITVFVATVLSLAGTHWYYKIKFFKKLRSLELSLADLEDE